MKFVRFGGLSSVNQKGYDPSMPGFHSPPMRRGIYAFPQGIITPFLLGGDRSTAKGSSRYIKDKDGNPIPYDDENDLYKNKQGRPYFAENGEVYYPDRNFYKVYTTKKKRDGKSYWVRPAEMKTFEYTGEIWHHLNHHVKAKEILNRKGAWILTDVSVFEKCLMKENFMLKMKSFDLWKTRNAAEIRKFGSFALDHTEIFIEKI